MRMTVPAESIVFICMIARASGNLPESKVAYGLVIVAERAVPFLAVSTAMDAQLEEDLRTVGSFSPIYWL